MRLQPALQKPILAALILLLCALSIAASQWNLVDAGLLCGVVANGLVIWYARQHTGSYSNLVVLFAAFSMLYGYSGPVAEMYGSGLHATFAALPATPQFVTAQALALSGFTLGLLPARRIYPEQYLRGARAVEVPPALIARRGKLMGGWAIGLAVLASIMEITNLMRIGGIGMLTQGKAIYQSLEADLVLTMPSYMVAELAFALLALSIGLGRRDAESQHRADVRKIVTWFLLSMLPLLLTTFLLGRRGPMIAWFLISIVGITLFRPITRLKRSLILGMLTIYVFMALVFSTRGMFGYAVSTGDWERYLRATTDVETMVERLSPGGTEFGAAFGNFSAFVADPESGILLGESYLVGLVIPVPAFLYPGPKPKQITYEFRDRYFAQTALQGEIAGTGFSSILEAYMNFGYGGVFAVYVLLAVILGKVERLRYKASRRLAIFPLLMYLMLLQQTQQFHRSAFGHVFGTLILMLLLVGAFQIVLTMFAWERPFRGLKARSAERRSPIMAG